MRLSIECNGSSIFIPILVLISEVSRSRLLGLACYMPDWRIPGRGAEQERHTKLDELVAELEVPAMNTKHAEVRAQQRRIPPLVDQLLGLYEHEGHDRHGAVIIYFTKDSIGKMERDLGRRRCHGSGNGSMRALEMSCCACAWHTRRS